MIQKRKIYGFGHFMGQQCNTQPIEIGFVIMEKEYKPNWDYFELIIFIAIWLGIFLFFVALLFGHHVGYWKAINVCFWYWIFILIVFLLIIALNLLAIGISQCIKYYKGKLFTESKSTLPIFF